jgi:hypothetical protein
MPSLIHVPISAGELVDKITILEIKNARIADEAKLRNIRQELTLLQGIQRQTLPASAQLQALQQALQDVNTRLWDIEDEVRIRGAEEPVSARFIELARAVYVRNDERFQLKRQINELVGSPLREEKSYGNEG